MFKSLRARLFFVLLTLVVSIMIVLGVILIANITNFYCEDFSSQMESFFAGTLADISEAAAGANAPVRLRELLSAYSGKIGVDSYRNFFILSADGSYLAGSDDELGRTLELTDNLLTAMNGGKGDTVLRSGNYMDYAVPVGNYIIYIRDTKTEMNDLSRVMVNIVLNAIIVALLLSVLMSFVLARAITNPIENITRGAKRIADGDFSYTPQVYADDELGTLTNTFNQMAGVLQSTLGDISREKTKLDTIFLYMTDGVVAFDAAGRLLHINRAAERMLSVAAGWREGATSFSDVFSALGLDVSFGDIQALEPNKNLVLDTQCGPKSLRVSLAAFRPSESAGQAASGVITVIHDVTEQQRLEQSRREFIANVSHELRTPLTNVKSYTETVLDNPGLPPERREKFLSIVLSETDRMSAIVRDLLVLSRLDSNKENWDFRDFWLPDMLRETYDSMLLISQKNNQRFMLDIAPEVGYLRGDKDRLQQVLVNIISNAMKYTPGDGEVAVTAAASEDVVRICVKDSGFGIPAADLPHIFERFYRVDKARSREMGGTGLGLSIAREIILAHDGEITVESEEGVGSAFTVILPLMGPAAASEMTEGRAEV